MIKNDPPLLVLDAEFEEEIEHSLLGKIAKGTLSTEYYWLDRWYNVFRFSGPDNSLKIFYCNINMPPKFTDGVLSYVDLDIDVLVESDFSYRVLDVDEFEENAERYKYSEQLRSETKQALDELISLIETRSLPFRS